jgi:hypothetical protein
MERESSIVNHWTDETDAEAVEFFDTLPIGELRRRQSVCMDQQMRAFDRKDQRALEDLQRMETALLHAVLRRIPS